MAQDLISNVAKSRLITAGLGAMAGWSLWLFIFVLDDAFTNQHLYGAVFCLVSGFFAVSLALIGPVGLLRALLGAALISVPVAVLFGLASLKHGDVDLYLKTGHPILSILTILVIGTPFIAACLRDRKSWRRYSELFDLSWTITVRFAAAWLFVGLFWVVLLLSSALLKIVGIPLIESLLKSEPIAFLLTGFVLGLALSVVHELREYVSPFLFLRLLRLLLPVVLAVMAVFIVALPIRGLSGLFGDFSVAGTLMAMVVAGITLVTTALDKNDANAVSAPWMRVATQMLAVLLPVMGGLSVYAIYLRVHQYGWTPDRLAAIVSAVFILIYAVLYALAVLLRAGWMQRIRRANVVMALGLVAVAVLWLSPVLNAETISTNSQVARFAQGRVSAQDLAVWQLAREWGSAGQAGVTRMRGMTEMPDHDVLLTRLAAAEVAQSKYRFARDQDKSDQPNNAKVLFDILPVFGAQVELTQGMIAELPGTTIEHWLTACQRTTQEGGPGCALVLTPVSGNGVIQARGVAFLLSRRDRVEVRGVLLRNNRLTATGRIKDETTGETLELDGSDLLKVQSGTFRIGPSSREALWLGDLELNPNN